RRMAGTVSVPLLMGLDVSNGLFGNFHLNWAGTSWFENWCRESQLPDPFIGWESGCNNGDLCVLGTAEKHTQLAKDWCEALEKKFPEIANLGKSLFENPPDLHPYMYSYKNGDLEQPRLSETEWRRRAVAAWYAILKHGVERGDTLEYW